MPVVAVNRSWELVPWADALYACDMGFWLQYRDAYRTFAGLKLSQSEEACRTFPGILRLVLATTAKGAHVHAPVREPVGTIASGRNSGFQALNWVAQLDPRRIVLVGFDMRGRHWHPDHGGTLRNPRRDMMAKWARAFDDAAPVYREWGIEILNASRSSAIRAFPAVNLDELLDAMRA
jgi:hypothetical protein